MAATTTGTRSEPRQALKTRVEALEQRVADLEAQLVKDGYYRRLHAEIEEELREAGHDLRLTREQALARLGQAVPITADDLEAVRHEDGDRKRATDPVVG